MKLKYLWVFNLLLPLLLYSFTGAGVEIRNQSSCTFEWNNNTYTVISNIVITRVLPVYSFNLTPDGTISSPGQLRYAYPGNTVYFNYVLINTGNGEDNYTLTTIVSHGNINPLRRAIYRDVNQNGRLDPGEDVPINELTRVEPNDPVYLIVGMDIPGSAHSGDSLYLNIIAISEGDTSLVDSNNWAITKVAIGPVITGYKQAFPPGTVSPGDSIVFRVNYVNNGMAFADTLIITEWIDRHDNLNYTTFVLHSVLAQPEAVISYYSNSQGRWTTTSPSDPNDVGGIRALYTNIWPGQTGFLQFTVDVDSNIQDTLVTNVAYVFYNSIYTNQRYSFTTNVTCNIIRNYPEVVIGPFGNPAVTPDSSENDMQVIDSARAGQWVYFRNSILNLGPGNSVVEIGVDTSNLNLDGGIVILTTADFSTPLYDSDNDGNVDVGPVNEGDTINIGVKIYIPPSSRTNGNHVVTLFVFTPFNTAALNFTIDRFRITAQAPTADVELNKSAEPDTLVYTNSPLLFSIEFENTGRTDLTDFNIYDVVDTLLSNINNITSGPVRDLNNPARNVNVLASYDTTRRIINWYIDTLPSGFRGQVSFSSIAVLDSGVSEGFVTNVASAISNELHQADTSNLVRVHVVFPALSIKKEVDKRIAETGDVVNYKVSITSSTPGGEILSNIVVTDTLPEGFKVIKNSVDVLNGNSNIDSVWVSKNKEVLKVYLDSLASGKTARIQYSVAIGPSADIGKHSNIAFVRGYLPGNVPLDAGPARAVVEITEGFASPRGFIFGKVFIDKNDNRIQDPDEPGVPDIGIQTDDGIYVLTDSLGRYHIPYLSPGPHIVRIDPRTIPRNVAVPPTSIDYLGGGYAQLIDLPVSSNRKANFRLIPRIHLSRQYRDIGVKKIAVTHVSGFKFNTTLPATYFETGKATLKKDAPYDKFREIAEFVRKHPGWKILIEGHTDPRPIHTPEFPNNYVLSLARANAVKRVFLQFGVPDSAIITKGYGPDRPKVPNTSLRNMAFNRRVEITLLPGKDKENADVVEYRITLTVNNKFNKSLWLVDKIPPDGRVIESSIKAKPGRFKYYVSDSIIIFYIPDFGYSRIYHLSYKVHVRDVASASQFVNTLTPVIKENGDYVLIPSVSTSTRLDQLGEGVGEIILKLQNNILFETGKADLKPGSEVVLNNVLKILKRLPDAVCEISGHTDPRPIHTKEFPSNWELSEARARSVYLWLARHGIDTSRMTYKGYADTRPIVPNTSLHNMQLNRRVEIVIKRKKEAKAGATADSNFVKMITLFVNLPFTRYMGEMKVMDKIPDGYNYIKNSATVNGTKIRNVSLNGKIINFIIPESVTKTLSDNFKVMYFVSRKKNFKIGEVSDQLKYLLEMTKHSYPDILYPPDSIVYRKGNAIRIKVGSIYHMPVELYVNGKRIGKKKIGVLRIDKKNGIEEREFVGIRLKHGKNIITLKTIDRRGKVVTIRREVYLPGSPAKVKLNLVNVPLADGHTRPVVRATVTDSSGIEVGDNIELTYVTNNLEIITPDDRPAVPGYQRITSGGKADVTLAPSLAPIHGRIYVYLTDSISDSLEVFYRPYASGLDAFGGFDIKGLYSFENKNLTPYEFAGIYLKGLLPADVVLTSTFRYNSYLKKFLEKEEERELLENYYAGVSTFNLYPSYGDASRISRVTTSRSGLFVRFDKERSFVQYGDFKTGIGGYSVAKYERALTGGLLHIENRFMEINGFLAPDKQLLYQDEFRANGTPGYFYLSHTPIIRNSEAVYVVTKNRVHPEVIIRKIKLAPFTDYSLDPATGALLLKEPVPSFDFDLNPNYIVVIYEVKVNAGKLAYAGSFAIKPVKGIKFGIVRGYSTPGPGRWYAINGVYGNVVIKRTLNAWFDAAQSDSTGRKGMAYAGGLKFNLGRVLKMELNYTKRDSDFVNQGNILRREGEELTFNSGLFITHSLSLTTGLQYRTVPENITSKSGEAMINKTFGSFLAIGMGYKVTREESDTAKKSVSSAVVGLNANLGSRFTIEGRHEQMLNNSDLTVNPPKSEIKMGLQLFKNLSLKGSFEHRWGKFGGDIGLIGLENSFTKNVSSYAKFRYEDNGLGIHNQIVGGLRNTLPISKILKLVFNGEYVKDLKYPELDHITAGVGFDYQKQGRFSFRFNLESRKDGYRTVSQLTGALPLSKSLILVTDQKFSSDYRKTLGKNNYLTDGYIGFAFRPAFTDKINTFFVFRHYYNTDTTFSHSNRMIFYGDINIQPFYALTISGRYGFKRLIGNYSLTSHLISLWMRLEFLRDRLYMATGMRSLYQPLVTSGEHDFSFEVGTVIRRNILVGVGYNIHGLSDSSYSEFEQTDRGIYFRIGGKFNIMRGILNP